MSNTAFKSIIETGIDGQPISPEIVLALRSGEKHGVIYNVTSVKMSYHLNEADEISFDVHKRINGTVCDQWENIKDFKLIFLPYYNKWYEISVTVDEDDETTKHVDGTNIYEAELSQLLLNEVEINTEDDIARDEYVITKLWDSENPDASMLSRILKDKATHYTVEHVDASIAKMQRMFSWNGNSILDAFNDIGEEIGCIFMFGYNAPADGKLHRTISVFDLEDVCLDCGNRDSMKHGYCPKCGSENIKFGFGEDSNVFMNVENFGERITYHTNDDKVKNCFRLEAGDDVVTAAVRSCNPNGTPYIWYLTDDMKKDMSEELQNKLSEYDVLYDDYRYYNNFELPSSVIPSMQAYNAVIVPKYQAYDPNIKPIKLPIVGYSELAQALYQLIDMHGYLKTSLLPKADAVENTTAQEQADKLTNESMSPIGVVKVKTVSQYTADSAVKEYAKVYVDTSRYQVKVISSSYNTTTNIWTGTLRVENYINDDDVALTGQLRIVFNDDAETYTEQKIEKAMKKMDADKVGIVELFKQPDSIFKNMIKEYSVDGLSLLASVCDACLSILIDQGISDEKSDLYSELYVPYYTKRQFIEDELVIRQEDLNILINEENGLIPWIELTREDVKSALDTRTYMGEELWAELSSFRRDDNYENSNYISDGLNDAQVFDMAREFFDVAEKELVKSATLQHTISGNLVDFLRIKDPKSDRDELSVLATQDDIEIITNLDEYIKVAEPIFAQVLHKWGVGNWLHIEVDDEIYRLRMIDYTIDFDRIEDLDVEFSDVIIAGDYMSDVASILDKAKSITTSYDTTKRQAEKGKDANQQLGRIATTGLELTNSKIINTASDQNLVMDENGLLMRRKDDYTDDYFPEQVKIINAGLYYTNDGWETAKAGIGRFNYYDPDTGDETEAYGVIADTVVGNLILGDELGIYSKNGDLRFDEDGLVITIDKNNVNTNAFKIRQKNTDGTYTNILYINNDGNANLSGTFTASNGSIYLTDNTISFSEYSRLLLDKRHEIISCSYYDPQDTDHLYPFNNPVLHLGAGAQQIYVGKGGMIQKLSMCASHTWEITGAGATIYGFSNSLGLNGTDDIIIQSKNIWLGGYKNANIRVLDSDNKIYLNDNTLSIAKSGSGSALASPGSISIASGGSISMSTGASASMTFTGSSVTMKSNSSATASVEATGSSVFITAPTVFGITSPTGTTKTYKPIYCAYNPNGGNHLYTASKSEYDDLIAQGWRADGIRFYAFA